MAESQEAWARCNACKGPIARGATYWVCSVSTCNRKRTGLRFCSVSCWEVHLPDARHREAWAVEKVAGDAPPARGSKPGASVAAAPATPTTAPAGEASASGGKRRIIRSAGSAPAPAAPKEVLIVASRLKDYVRARSGFNTSDKVLAPLSDIVRRVADEAIRHARSEGRQTVLDRDIPDDA